MAEERPLDLTIRIEPYPDTIACVMSNTAIKARFDQAARINIVSKEVRKALFPDIALTHSDTQLHLETSSLLPALGSFKAVDLLVEGLPITLEFHVFEIPDPVSDFVLLIFPLKELIRLAKADDPIRVTIGKESVSIDYARALNSKVDLPAYHNPMEEAFTVRWIEPPALKEEDIAHFTQEEIVEDFVDLDETEVPKPAQVELKPLPPRLKYIFLHNDRNTPTIISDALSEDETGQLVALLEKYKSVIGYSLKDLKGISPSLYTHRVPMEPERTPTREHQRRLNEAMREVVKKEVLKLLHAGIIYPVSDSKWVSPVQVVPKKGGMTVVENEKNELIPQRTVTGWRMCIDYRKLNKATRKDHFPLPFIDEMLERLANHSFFCFLDGYSGYPQIPIHPDDQSKTTFTCPYGTFAYRRMSFGLCNAPASFQRCMTAIFSDLIEQIMEVFMDDFTIYGKTFDNCLINLEKVFKRCKE